MSQVHPPLKPIPIYDASAPICCTIEGAEIPERIELVERMRHDLDRIERLEHGMRLHFPARPDTEADLRRFATDEKRCCQFWGFAVETHDDEVTLRWEAPPAAAGLIDRLISYFEGDEPLTAITGLL